MSSSDDDMLSYTPLQRSQVSSSQRKPKPNLKLSRLSLSQRNRIQTTQDDIEDKKKVFRRPSPNRAKKRSRNQTSENDVKAEMKTVKETTPRKAKKRVTKSTPVKSRADRPENNCNDFELAKWRFLYDPGEVKAEQKPRPRITNFNERDTSQRSADALLSINMKNEQVEVKHMCETEKPSKDVVFDSCPQGAKCSATDEVHYLLYNHEVEPKKTSQDALSSPRESDALNGHVDEVEPDNSFISDSGFNGGGDCGPSTSGVLPAPVALHRQSDVFLLSDSEEDDHKSEPLFDLVNIDHATRESVDHEKSTSREHVRRDSVASGSSTKSSILLNLPFSPIVQMTEDDQETVYYEEDRASHKSSIFGNEQEERQPLPAAHPEDSDKCSSRTPDFENVESEHDEAGDLEDSEGDEMVASVVEDVLSNVAIPALEKVMKWREESKESLAALPPEHRQNLNSRRLRRKCFPAPCIHLHFHEASPSSAPSSVRESGQTSILQFFKSSKPREESCTCGDKKTGTREESIAAWKSLLGQMQKKKLVPIPSVSDSTSQDLVSDSTSKGWRQKSQAKPCPFYKCIPETNFVVDAFNYGTINGVTAYFLSHFHYDHYIGLRRNFNQPIYCSEITARLVNKKLGVPLKYLNALPMWEPQQVHGVEVTLLDANHCPGSVMFLFKVKPGVTHLHVGDFRADPSMENYTALKCPITTLFLDTTYCSPQYDFPSQEKIIEKCVSIAHKHHQENAKTLFVVGSYTIGKERVFKAIAESLNCSIWVSSSKKLILSCIDDVDILSRLTNSKAEAKVHVLPMAEIKEGKLKDYLDKMKSSFTDIVGLCPTGWESTRASKGGSLDQITSRQLFPNVYRYGVPYSEHSSFSELKKFVQFIRPWTIIPTVNNGNQASRQKMEKYFKEWLR